MEEHEIQLYPTIISNVLPRPRLDGHFRTDRCGNSGVGASGPHKLRGAESAQDRRTPSTR